MKQLLFGTLTFVLLLSAQASAAELLINPGLDDPPDHETDIATGWTLVEPSLDGNGVAANSATFASFANHNTGGTRGLWYRSFEGGLGGNEPFEVDAHLYQDVAGTPGNSYSLSAWYRYETNFPGGNPFSVTDVELALEFLDAGDAVIGGDVVLVDDQYPGNDSWFQVFAEGIAPVGTVSVRARSSMLSGVLVTNNPQSAFVDDFSLVPEPASAMLLLVPALGLLRRRS